MKNLKKLFVIAFSLPIIILYNSCETTDPGDDDTGYHNKILFTSRVDEKDQLFMMNPDGTEIKQITSGQYWNRNGRWSPDGKKIVCNTEEETTTAGITMVVMNADGTGRELIGPGIYMNWSPNNEEITFDYMPRAELGDLTSNIYVTNYITKKRTILVDSLTIINHCPVFSPDGNAIAYSSNIDFPVARYKSELYLLNIKEKKTVRQTYLDSGVLNPVWSSDGNMIYFSSVGIIYYLNLSDDTVNRIKESEGYTLRNPCISPDGNKLLVIGYLRDGSAKSHLFIMDKNGENLKRLLENDDYVTYCDWSK
jgi:Tol biopolymer transport system component